MTDKDQEQPLKIHTTNMEYHSFCQAWLSHLTPEQQRRLLLLHKIETSQTASEQIKKADAIPAQTQEPT